MPNFSFLETRPEYALFAPACIEAEKIYATAPALCAVGCRKALELAVKWVYAADTSIEMPYRNHLQSLLHEPSFRFAMDVPTWNKLPMIVKLGNLAVHTGQSISKGEALAALHALFEFVQIARIRTSFFRSLSGFLCILPFWRFAHFHTYFPEISFFKKYAFLQKSPVLHIQSGAYKLGMVFRKRTGRPIRDEWEAEKVCGKICDSFQSAIFQDKALADLQQLRYNFCNGFVRSCRYVVLSPSGKAGSLGSFICQSISPTRRGEYHGYVDQQLYADDGALSAVPLDETKLYPGQPVKRGNTGIQNKICYF